MLHQGIVIVLMLFGIKISFPRYRVIDTAISPRVKFIFLTGKPFEHPSYWECFMCIYFGVCVVGSVVRHIIQCTSSHEKHIHGTVN